MNRSPRRRRRFLPPVPLLALLPLLPVAATATAQDTAPPTPPSPLNDFTNDWREDPIWYDGKAEVATYSAARTIYGEPRKYTATLYTNKERLDLTTTTKAEGQGEATAEVFKHHLREDIPTPNYHYHYSTMAYVGAADLHPYKVEVGSIEACGTTFKRFWNPADGPLEWVQFSYFPDQGRKEGELDTSAGFVPHDTLSLVLRGYPFDSPPEEMTLRVMPDQTTNKWSPVEPVSMRVRYEGLDSLNGLPIGSMKAHHLVVEPVAAGDAADESVRVPETPVSKIVPEEAPEAWHYWFAQGPRMQHVMVKMQGPAPGGGVLAYELAGYERAAYWERGK